MQGPINYKIDVADPFASYARGLELGLAQRQMQAQQQQQQQMQSELQALSADPTPKNILKMIARYPDLAAKLSSTHQYQNEQMKKAEISQAYKVYHAVGQNRPDVAIKELEMQAAAKQNSGDTQGAEEAKGMIDLLRKNPKEVYGRIGLMLAADDPDTYSKLNDIRNKNELQPFTLSKTISDASESASKAKIAQAQADDIDAKILADRQATQAATALAQSRKTLVDQTTRLNELKNLADKETSALTKQKLTADIAGLEEKNKKEKAEQRLSVLGSLRTNEGMESTVKELIGLLSDPKNELAVYRGVGPVAGRVATVSDTVKTIEDKLKLVKNKVFLTQLPLMKNLGSLSNADRDGLATSAEVLESTTPAPVLLQSLKNLLSATVKTQESILKEQGDFLDPEDIKKYTPKPPETPPKAGEKPKTPFGAKPKTEAKLPEEIILNYFD